MMAGNEMRKKGDTVAGGGGFGKGGWLKN